MTEDIYIYIVIPCPYVMADPCVHMYVGGIALQTLHLGLLAKRIPNDTLSEVVTLGL